jgi:hypothetical protein
MKSPFPGKDPRHERNWRDIHTKLETYSADALNASLPGDLIARQEERVVVDSAEFRRAIYPDVRVYEDPAQSGGGAASAVVAEPIVLLLETEEHVETFVTILDENGGELVTVIEFLSPTNKLAGDGRNEYRKKRSELSKAKVNMVEVDLIRQGSWRELLAPLVAPARAESEYRVISRRARGKARAELFPISLRARLPIIPIPLREGDVDVPLDLQKLVDQVYANGRYDRTRYTLELDPLLGAEDAAWADELLRAAGKK